MQIIQDSSDKTTTQKIQEKYNIHLTTTNDVKGFEIVLQHGMVTGNAAEVVYSFGSCEKAVDEAMCRAVEAMVKQALRCGANAIVATSINVAYIGANDRASVTCHGTAVNIKET